MPSKFDTEIVVRPNEIDYNGHVHQSVYLDYLLFARVTQMRQFYKMPIEVFFKRGYSWATKSTYIEFQNPLFLNETAIVRTWVEEIKKKSIRICFQILKKKTEILSAEGYAVYVLINAKTGKPEIIPEDIKDKYSI
jgi:acyl-CoA thioester hydrolase/thioesterase-3